MARKKIDITGHVYGRLTVISFHSIKNGNARWLCLCECGKTTISHLMSLRRGSAKSCGCLRNELRKLNSTTHGMSYSKIHRIWRAMLERCHNVNCKGYRHYGGRGITVCDEWLEFGNFFEDMGDRPTPKHSLDRVNTELGYSKANCRWATMIEQQNNRRDNVWITYKGKTKTTSQWSRFFNLPRRLIADRFKAGHNLEDVFSNKSLKTGKPIKSSK